MADPTTELAREFLEFNNYLVRKEVKFYHNKKLIGTPSDIDIIATSPKGISVDGLELKENVVAEVKSWQAMHKSTIDEIYKDKFRYIDNPRISRKQLRKIIPSGTYDKVLFCLATTQEIFDYAKAKYGIIIITTGFMIKHIARFFTESPRRWTYYPEWFNYNIIKSIMFYLFNSYMGNAQWKDKLNLEDLVWIDPELDPRYRNQFVQGNANFFEDFIYHQTSGEVFVNLVNRMAKSHRKWFKNVLRSNTKFWKYLTSSK
jgi:hypothetical protein